MIHLVAQGMSYGEFFFFYMLLPWAIALVGGFAAIFVYVIGGSELRTIISGKLNPRAHFILGWSDGGKTELRTYVPFEPHIMMRRNYQEFLTYSTALPEFDSGVEQVANLITFEQARKAVPSAVTDEQVRGMVEVENAKRIAAASDLNSKRPEMFALNDAASTKTSFCGKPLWVGHISAGAALQPELLRKIEKTKAWMKLSEDQKEKAKAAVLDFVSPESIKDWFLGNFNSGILYSILRCGIDYGKYGKPKQPFPMFVLIIVFLAIGLLVLGFLIISGKLDVSGFVKGLGLGV